jgi:hypothetical protein
MAQTWQVETPLGVCAATGKKLCEGEVFYSALVEDGESFRRVDYSVEAWPDPPPTCFCYFKSKVPVREKRKRVFVDDEILIQFFQRLADQPDGTRVQFRFVLGLILMRKRLLRYESTTIENGREAWTLTLTRDRSTHRVLNPGLTEEQIEGVSRQLTAILHSDMGTWTDPTPAEADPPGGDA